MLHLTEGGRQLFLWFADWNITPAELREQPWLQEMRAEVVVPLEAADLASLGCEVQLGEQPGSVESRVCSPPT